jgi:hypothetical protein
LKIRKRKRLLDLTAIPFIQNKYDLRFYVDRNYYRFVKNLGWQKSKRVFGITARNLVAVPLLKVE